MSVTREDIAAYADGELSGEALARIETAIAADPTLASQVEAHLALKKQLAAHFAPIAAEPVPDRLASMLPGTQGGGKVVDITAMAIRKRGRILPRRQWRAWTGVALAASLVLAILLARPGGTPEGYASGVLAQTLNTQLAANQTQGGTPRILLSFPNAKGKLCRGYADTEQSGIACRDAIGWKIERTFTGNPTEATDYRQAGSASDELMAAMQDMAAGAPLDAEAEAAAREADWLR